MQHSANIRKGNIPKVPPGKFKTDNVTMHSKKFRIDIETKI